MIFYETDSDDEHMDQILMHAARTNKPDVQQQTLESRIMELEDAITEAGIILAEGELTDMPQEAIRRAMQRLGSVMSKPEVLKRQGSRSRVYENRDA